MTPFPPGSVDSLAGAWCATNNATSSAIAPRVNVGESSG